MKRKKKHYAEELVEAIKALCAEAGFELRYVSLRGEGHTHYWAKYLAKKKTKEVIK